MRKEQFLKASVLLSIAILCVGCKSNSGPKPIKHPTTVNKPAEVAPQKSGITLSELDSGGKVTLTLEGPHEYKSGDPIQFSLDTRGAEGYLYVVYLDSNGKTGVLYPNLKAPPSQTGGKHVFPRDFGDMQINATKDCQGCEKEKTVLYAFLTQEPILDIQQINKSQLLKIVGGGNKAKTKGINMNLEWDENINSGNVNMGIFEFFVK
jgi:hypothetical protein